MTVAPTPFSGRRVPRYHISIFTALLLCLLAVGIALLIQHNVSQSSSGSTTTGSGRSVAQSRVLPPFDRLELRGSNVLTVQIGGRQAVVVHADDNLVRRVTTEVRAGRLLIGNTSGSFKARSPMRVAVTVPTLAALTLSGSGVITVSGIHAPRFTIDLPGSGVLHASGRTAQLDVTLNGSGDAQLSELVARDVHATVGGSGRILVTATKSLRAKISGSGAIMYGGSPASVSTDVTGSGAVIPG